MTADAGRIAVLTSGLARLAGDVERLTGLKPVRVRAPFGLPSDVVAVAGWGHKPTADRARDLAAARGVPYLALEDGFLRSVLPGRAATSVSYVVDRAGIYTDARQPSDLETLIRDGRPGPDDLAAARRAIERIRRDRLSKYNAGAADPAVLGDLAGRRDLAVVVDQTLGDASVAGALADAAAFEAMLDEAVAGHGAAGVVAKIHPEVARGAKQGYLADLAARRGVRVLAADVDPWLLIERAHTVYTVSSQLGYDALIGGCRVVCHGLPFYAGWGLTEDRLSSPRRSVTRSLDQLVFAAHLAYCRYLDPWFREPAGFDAAADAIVTLRSAFRAVDRPVVTVGLSGWKRRVTAPFLTGAAGPPRHARTVAAAAAEAARIGGVVALWGPDPAPPAGVPHVRLEDGFLRSAGLGLLRVPPASLIVDDLGLYMDARTPSRFERIAETLDADAALLRRAADLRRALVAARVTKYNVGRPAILPDAGGRRRILVPGQVEDDTSVRLSSPVVRSNAALLAAVRRRHPDAFVAYKPHPDVLTGLRPGRVAPDDLARLADAVIDGADMAACLDWCDAVETMTSLAGFEALLRGKAVAVHGRPFYAGWGLTEDLAPLARRTRRLALDELVAAAVLLYPRYADPATGLPATPEVVVRRLAEQRDAVPTLASRSVDLYRRSLSVAIHRLVVPVERWAAARRAGDRSKSS